MENSILLILITLTVSFFYWKNYKMVTCEAIFPPLINVWLFICVN